MSTKKTGAADDQGSGDAGGDDKDKKPMAEVAESIAALHKKVDQLGEQCKAMHDDVKAFGKKPDAAPPAAADDDEKKALKARVAELEAAATETENEVKGLLEDLKKTGAIE